MLDACVYRKSDIYGAYAKLHVLTIRACSRPIVMTVRLMILNRDTTISWICWNVSPWVKQRQREMERRNRQRKKRLLDLTDSSGFVCAAALPSHELSSLWRQLRLHTQSKASLGLWIDGWQIKWNKKENKSFLNLKFKVCSRFRKWASPEHSVNHLQCGHLNRKGFWHVDVDFSVQTCFPIPTTTLSCFFSSICLEGNKGDEMCLTACLCAQACPKSNYCFLVKIA